MDLCGMAARIEIVEPAEEECSGASLPPEGNVKLRNYRVLTDTVRAYTPTGDVHTSPQKGKLVSRFDVCTTISPPRARILQLLRAEDPGREALEAIVQPAPRRGLTRPLDDDTRRFLQRALLSPSPQGLSAAATPEPRERTPEPERPRETPQYRDIRTLRTGRSLFEELAEAEQDEQSGCAQRQMVELQESHAGSAVERERLGRLALSVEEEEEGGLEAAAGLSGAARRLDALLAESRRLHAELAGIHRDMQSASIRAWRCAEAARALVLETQALRYLDDVVALLRGDVACARRAAAWPFALGPRQPGRNYVV